MPCRSEWPEDTSYRYKVEMDRATRIACELAKKLEQGANPVTIAVPWFSKETSDWWKKHKESDARRLEAEAKAMRIRTIKEQALNKLSREERRALGLPDVKK